MLPLMKERLGIRTEIRDGYLSAIAAGVIDEMENQKGLALDGASPSDLMFCVDFACWRHQSRDSGVGMPRHLQLRLHEMMIGNKDE